MQARSNCLVALIIAGVVGCYTPASLLPRAKFGLAAVALPSTPVRELAPVDEIQCMDGFEPTDWSEAVEAAIAKNPPANAIMDARLTIELRGGERCVRVIGTAVVLE